MLESPENIVTCEVAQAVLERAEPCQPEARQWYAVHTRSRHEEVVSRRLRAKLIEPFLPKIEVWSRCLRRRRRLLVPLFPCYLFVHVAMEHPLWLEIVRTGGVVRVLGNSRGSLPVPEAQIDSVRRLLESKALLSPHPYLESGRRVRVVSGPLAGCEGILLRRRAKGRRLAIAVDIIRRAVSVELEAADVEPA
jgi:transcription antitermination factor NusG